MGRELSFLCVGIRFSGYIQEMCIGNFPLYVLRSTWVPPPVFNSIEFVKSRDSSRTEGLSLPSPL